MNILDRGITPEPGFPRRNLNSHARAAARVPYPKRSHFRKNFWQSVYSRQPGFIQTGGVHLSIVACRIARNAEWIASDAGDSILLE